MPRKGYKTVTLKEKDFSKAKKQAEEQDKSIASHITELINQEGVLAE